MSHQASSWLESAVSRKGIAQIVRAAVKALKGIDFDTIAFRGMSGALIAPIVAHKLKKEICVVRKPNDGSHSYYQFEGYLKPEKYIIFDDFIGSGTTGGAIVKAMRLNTPAKLVGVYTYYSSGTGAPGFHTVESNQTMFELIRRYSD
jgi:orotate phosphoribosyltransferase